MDDTQLKRDIQKLVDEFRANHDSYRKQLEANTETKLVEPLFKLLGWNPADFEKQAAAKRGQKSGHADYAFKINDKIVFFLEVKKVGIALDKEADKQVISYALSKRIPFAVSTNFEETKIFCVEQENAIKNVFRIFTRPEDYVNNLSDLKFLSKQSFEEGLTLKRAETEGRLKKRITIDKTLLDDLMRIRSLIASDIEKTYPQKYELNEKDEIVQRIIDRLIFIRRCEDIGINPDKFSLEEIKHSPDNKAHPKLKEIFKTYNDVYDGGLFAIGVDNDCDKITIDGGIIKKLIYYLYESKDGNYVYNFDWIDADVLGQVYEQYLGKILAQTKSGKAKLTEGQAHRKEQGIYYTPTYIVDYIVRNTVGQLLSEKKVDVTGLKILDPACGSGSFLIKAFDYLSNHISKDEIAQQKRIDAQGMYSIKTQILKNNVYGVDLDNKAIEITKLNLLLKAAEKGRKLPQEVDLHIRYGNSLIDDEAVAGTAAFKWVGDFKEGSFDAVIGNPPYVRVQTTKEEDKEYLEKNYVAAQGKFDLYTVFIEKALKLLKPNGYFSFIIPNKFTQTKYGKTLKEFILKNFTIQRFIDFGDLKVFGEVTTYPCIMVIKNSPPSPQTSGTYVKVKKLSENIEQKILKYQTQESFEDDDIEVFKFKQKDLSADVWSFLPASAQKIFDKIDNSSKVRLVDLRERIFEGFITGNNSVFFMSKDEATQLKIEKDILKPVPKGKNVRRFSIKWDGEYVLFPHKLEGDKTVPVDLSEYPHAQKYLESHKTDLLKRKYVTASGKKWYEIWNTRNLNWFSQDKIITPNLSASNNFSVDFCEQGTYFFVDHDCYGILLKEKKREHYLFILAILNSKLIEFFIKQKSPMFSGGYYKYHTQYLENVPIIDAPPLIKGKLVEISKKLLAHNKRVNAVGDKQTAEKAKLELETTQLETELNEIIYELYHISKEEQRIIKQILNTK